MEQQLESKFSDSLVRSDSGIGLSDFSSDCQVPFTETKKERKSLLSSFEDPLNEPMVRYCLTKTQINSCQLINMSVKELNRRLSDCSPIMVSMLKRCRRTLKNRGYAKNCRIKRIATKNKLEEANTVLMRENKELRDRNELLSDQIRDLISKQTDNFNSQNMFPTRFDETQRQQPHGQRINGYHSNFTYQTYSSNDHGGYSTDRDVHNPPNCTDKISLVSADESSYTDHYDAELDYLMETTIPETSSFVPNTWSLSKLST